MPSLMSFMLTFALFLAIVSSAPSKLRGRSFKVHQKRQDFTSPRPAGSGVAAMGKAYRKFGISIPETQTTPVAKRRDLGVGYAVNLETRDVIIRNHLNSRVIATAEEGDAEFLSPITIGGQPVNVDFDTGSSDLWVFNPLLPDFAESGHSLYDPTKSTTFKPLPEAIFKISYGDSSQARGTVGTDTVNIGGAVVLNQAIELATDVTDGFIRDANSDGLLGLGFSSINTVQPKQQRTFFDNIQSSLELPLFTANLRHHSVGAYEFGKIDASQFQGPLTFTPVDNSRGFWEFESSSFAIGDGEIHKNENASPAIADTGTSLNLVDDFVLKAYWDQVPGAVHDRTLQAMVFPCDANLPDFHVALGPNYMAKIPGPLMNFSRAQGLPGSKLVPFQNATLFNWDPNHWVYLACFGGMQSNRGQRIQIYGDVMFKSQFVVFHGGERTIGFAPHAI